MKTAACLLLALAALASTSNAALSGHRKLLDGTDGGAHLRKPLQYNSDGTTDIGNAGLELGNELVNGGGDLLNEFAPKTPAPAPTSSVVGRKLQGATDSVISTLTPTVTEIGEQSQQLGDAGLAEGTALLNSYGANIPTPAPASAVAGRKLRGVTISGSTVSISPSVLEAGQAGLDEGSAGIDEGTALLNQAGANLATAAPAPQVAGRKLRGVISTLSPTITSIGDQSTALGDAGLAEGTAALNSAGAGIPTPAPTADASTAASTDASVTTLSPTITAIGDQSTALGDAGLAEGTAALNSAGAGIPTPAPTGQQVVG